MVVLYVYIVMKIKTKIEKLHSQGMRKTDIAKELGIARNTVNYHLLDSVKNYIKSYNMSETRKAYRREYYRNKYANRS